jgi:hypothetical protein
MVQTHRLTDRDRFMVKELHQDHMGGGMGGRGFILLELLQFVAIFGLALAALC